MAWRSSQPVNSATKAELPYSPLGPLQPNTFKLVKAGFIEIRHANGQARKKARKADSIILMLACAAR
jgi:hypothetical protein